MKAPVETADFLVIGTGIAGLWMALKAADHGSVILVTKRGSRDSNTNRAQGGIAAVVSSWDTTRLHFKDTLRVGRGLCDRRVVRRVVEHGPALVRGLIDVGVRFTYCSARRDYNNLDLGREGGHSEARVVRAEDLTGREIERALLLAVRQRKNIAVWTHHTAVDFRTARNNRGDRRCRGAWIHDQRDAAIVAVEARATLIATGGLGWIYRHTTNPPIATGDGIAMSYRAGCRVANMEFVQFHPTSLYWKGSRGFLISEALRGAGGILRNAGGEAFMERYHALRDLAPRDVVARAITAESAHIRPACAYLDMTHLKADFTRKRFPNIHARCLELGLDITRELIPVVPAAHYCCGGVLTDRDGGTDLPGLWAAGEVACTGMHGANRLASNSLLEAVAFAEFAVAAAAGYSQRVNRRATRTATATAAMKPTNHKVGASNWNWLRSLMWKHCGISRDHDGLTAAIRELSDARKQAERQFKERGVSVDTIQYRNATLVGELIARCALARTESRGLQHRTDYRRIGSTSWKKNTIVSKERT